MMKARKESLNYSMMFNFICKPLSMLVSYLYVPIVLNYLGTNKYGVWATLLTILSWISYFDIGIGNGLRNKLTESIIKKDDQGKKLVTASYVYISMITFCLGTIFTIFAYYTNWNRVFGISNFDENILAIVILCIWVVSINFVLSICRNILFALQKSELISIMELVTQLINLSCVIIVQNIVSGSLLTMALIYGFSMIIVNLVMTILLFHKNNQIKPNIKCLDLSVGRSITHLGMQFFVIQICALILYSTDSFIISFLYGANNVTPYNIVNKIFVILIGLFSALANPIWSAVSKAKAQKRYEDIHDMIKKLKLIMVPFFIVAILLALILRPLSYIWLGIKLDISFELILFGLLYCILSIWCNTYASISNGLQIMKAGIIIAVIQALVNIPFSLFLAETLSMKSAGVLGGTVITMLIPAIAIPVVIYRELNKVR